jgi:hypothetical protein
MIGVRSSSPRVGLLGCGSSWYLTYFWSIASQLVSTLGMMGSRVAAFAIKPAGHTIFAGTNGDGVVSLSLGG